MDTQLTRTTSNSRLRRDLSRDAISLALKGEWERAAQLNRAILELFEDDVDAMNRLGKALMELTRYAEAREVLDRVVKIAPYNAIAKKNLVRLEQLETAPVPANQVRKTVVVPQLFIEESGKSGTTVLQKPAPVQVVARAAPSDRAALVVERDVVNIYTRDNDYLGQIEPKLGRRLIRLMCGGNKYEAAIIGVRGQRVSIIIRETYRHRSLQNVCSFPTKSKEEHRVYLSENLVRYIRDDELEEEEEENAVIEEEEEPESDWGENE